MHAPLTAAVLLWLSIWRPKAYPRVRWTMVSVTGLALIGHILFPLAPPRMMPGFIDTGLRFGQSVYGPENSGGVANQFAAMPSLHVGWAALIALSMILITRSKWRWLWLLHPIITFAVVVVTAKPLLAGRHRRPASCSPSACRCCSGPGLRATSGATLDNSVATGRCSSNVAGLP